MTSNEIAQDLRIYLEKRQASSNEVEQAIRSILDPKLNEAKRALQDSERKLADMRSAMSGREAAAAPAIVVTSPMEKRDREQLQEDLRVMDQLFRDELKHQEPDRSRYALGIILLLSGPSQPAPIYVEGYGAIFNFEVEIPIAGPEKAADNDKEEASGSAWDRARHELRGSGGAIVPRPVTGPPGEVRWTRRVRMPYMPERVEVLVETIIKSMAEAKNIRNLKPTDAITVSIGGVDNTGEPARLTLKALKSDIDKLAEGKMTPEEFRKTIVRNVG